MRRAATTAAVLGVLAVAATGCGGYGKSKSGGGNTSSGGKGGQMLVAGVNANNHGMKTVSGETKVEIHDYYFKPTVLKGSPGQKVTLELENEGKVEHNFSVPSEGIDMNLAAGKDAKVMVTIPKSAVASFFCKFHKGMGMAGALAAPGANISSSGSGGGTTTGTSTGGGYYP
jgi:plastocyanin